MIFKLKYRKKSYIRLSLLIVLVLGILFSAACISGLQPVGWSGVKITADGTLFTGTTEGRLIGIYPDDSLLWSEPLKAESSGGFGCAPSVYGGTGCGQGGSSGVAIYGTPVIVNDLVYAAGYNGKVYAFNSGSLQLRWIYPREDYVEPIIAGLANDANTIYFADSSGKIYALDAQTGDNKWDFQAADKVWSTPVIDGSTLYIGCFDKKLYAIDTTTGTKQWDFETGGAIQGSPLVYKNTVYTGSFDNTLYAVDAATGKEKWTFTGEKWFWARPLAYENTIIAGCLDGLVYLLNAQTGAKIAEFDLESPIASSPVMVNNHVFVATHAGSVYKLDTTTNSIKQIASVGAQVNAPLSATDKILYIHTASNLTINPIDIESGAKLMPISLKSGE